MLSRRVVAWDTALMVGKSWCAGGLAWRRRRQLLTGKTGGVQEERFFINVRSGCDRGRTRDLDSPR
jgi:hypothetical protein